jgi:hypothetical protein
MKLPKMDGGLRPEVTGQSGRRAMQRGMPVIRFAAKVATQSVTAVLATLLGGYLLTALNLRSSDPAQSPAAPAEVTEGRALTREYVKSLRQGHEDVAEVRPTGTPPVVTEAPANETVVPKAAAVDALSSRTVTALARKENRIRTDVASSQPVVAIPAAAPPLGAPIVLAPAAVAVVNNDDEQTAKPAATEHQGKGSVFSAFSVLLGNAANAAGDGINFVIDLPAKAVGHGRETRRTATPVRDSQPAAADTPRSPPLQFAGS